MLPTSSTQQLVTVFLHVTASRCINEWIDPYALYGAYTQVTAQYYPPVHHTKT